MVINKDFTVRKIVVENVIYKAVKPEKDGSCEGCAFSSEDAGCTIEKIMHTSDIPSCMESDNHYGNFIWKKERNIKKSTDTHLDRYNRDIPYITGRMIAITEHYAGHKFGPGTLTSMFMHPSECVDIFRRYIDYSDEYYQELYDIRLPVTTKNEIEKSQMWVGYYHQKSAYNSMFLKKDIRGRIMTKLDELGMTQRWLAEQIGITPQELNGFLRGRQAISLPKLERIFGILDI
jgi:hypothetical protein